VNGAEEIQALDVAILQGASGVNYFTDYIDHIKISPNINIILLNINTLTGGSLKA